MPYGKESRTALVKLIGGKSVKIYVYDLDQFGRYVGDIYCNNLFIQVKHNLFHQYLHMYHDFTASILMREIMCSL